MSEKYKHIMFLLEYESDILKRKILTNTFQYTNKSTDFRQSYNTGLCFL